MEKIIRRVRKNLLHKVAIGVFCLGLPGTVVGAVMQFYYGCKFVERPDFRPLAELIANPEELETLSPESRHYAEKAIDGSYLFNYSAITSILGCVGGMIANRPGKR